MSGTLNIPLKSLHLALVLAVCGMASIVGAAPEFYLRAEPSETMIGGKIQLSLEIHEPDFDLNRIQAVAFDPEPDPQRWHVDQHWWRDWKPREKEDEPAWHATLRPFELGGQSLPPVTVIYDDAEGEAAEATVDAVLVADGSTTRPARIEVLSVRPPESETIELIGLRGPATLRRDWSWVLGAGAIVAVGLAIGFLLWRWWRRRSTVSPFRPSAPPVPPAIWALQELERGRRLPVCQSGPSKVIFTIVSDVIRRYLDLRYGIDALDKTTLETIRALERKRVDADFLAAVQSFLDECDLIKFTRQETSRPRWDSIWNDASQLVRMSTPPEELTEPGKVSTSIAMDESPVAASEASR